MLKAIRTLQILTFFLLGVGSLQGEAYSGTRESILTYQEHVQEKIAPLVKGFDPDAFVLIEIERVTRDAILPMTTVKLSNVTVIDADGDFEIKKVRVKIFARLDQIDTDLKSLILETMGELKDRTEIELKTLPTGFKSAEEQEGGQGWIWGIGIAAGLIALTLLMNGVFFRRHSSELMDKLEGQLKNLNSNIEESSALGGDLEELDSTAATPGAIAGGGMDPADVFASFSEESLIALISDCYWCEKDRFAAYIWQNTPVAKKQAVLDQTEYMRDYTAYIVSQEPERIPGLEQDPFYLNPFDLSHLNNEAVTQLVKKNQVQLSQLSGLRAQSLSLSATERIELNESDSKQKDSKQPDLNRTKASELRRLKKRMMLVISSVEEEQEILKRKDFTIDLKESIPSLAWLTELKDEQMSEILKPFSAKDLAAAWIGPEEVLNRLAQAVPEKKLELMKSYSDKIKPRRDSAAFRRIHSKSIDALTQLESNQGDDEVEKTTRKKAA